MGEGTGRAPNARQVKGLEYPCSLLPEWRNGRRRGLKIPRSQGRAGSSPASGTRFDGPPGPPQCSRPYSLILL